MVVASARPLASSTSTGPAATYLERKARGRCSRSYGSCVSFTDAAAALCVREGRAVDTMARTA